jgi:hypothetical protein
MTSGRPMVRRVTAGAALLSLALAGIASARPTMRSTRPASVDRAERDTRPDDTDADDGGDAARTRDEDDRASSGTARAAPRGAGPTYTIRSGDTLWNVSQSVMRDARGWPKLWALNPTISNPHWIYPGQVVRLREGEGLVEEDGDDADGTATRGNPAASVSLSAEPRSMVVAPRPSGLAASGRGDVAPLRQLGFVDEGALSAAGTVNGSIEEKIMLATGDQAYVEFPASNRPRPGARYSVYDVDREHPLRSPGSDATLGHLVRVSGDIVIDEVSDRNIASGHLVNLAGPVERGYRVGPVIPQMRAVAPSPNRAQVTARIVASVDPRSLLAHQMFVILDCGRRQGVEPGNRFLVLRQGDGLKRLLESWDSSDPRFPPYAAAEIVAVDVGDATTVGWISRGSRELRVGDVADLRRGY